MNNTYAFVIILLFVLISMPTLVNARPLKKFYLDAHVSITYWDDSGSHTFTADIKGTLYQGATYLQFNVLVITVNDLPETYAGPARIYKDGVMQEVEYYVYGITFGQDFGGTYPAISFYKNGISPKIPIDKMKVNGITTMQYFSMITRQGSYHDHITDYDFFIKSSGTIKRISQTSWIIDYNQAKIKQGLFQRYPWVDYPSDDYVNINPIQSISGSGTIILPP